MKSQTSPVDVRNLLQHGLLVDERTVFITDSIDNLMWSSLIGAFNYYKRKKSTKPVTLMINSPGGSVYDALAICDEIAELNKYVTTFGIVSGICMSAAVPVLQSCLHRFARPHATFMLHEAQGRAGGSMSEQEAYVKEGMRAQAALHKITETRAGQKITLKGNNRYLDVQGALKLGLLDSVLGA